LPASMEVVSLFREESATKQWVAERAVRRVWETGLWSLNIITLFK